MVNKWGKETGSKVDLEALGIDRNTDPNDPSTWSDRLKGAHARTVRLLPDEKKANITVTHLTTIPSATSEGRSIDTNRRSLLNDKYESLRAKHFDNPLPGDGPDGRPSEVLPEDWNTLNDSQKNIVKDTVRSRRFSKELYENPENKELAGAVGTNYSKYSDSDWKLSSSFGYKYYTSSKKTETPEQEKARKAVNADALLKSAKVYRNFPELFDPSDLHEVEQKHGKEALPFARPKSYLDNQSDNSTEENTSDNKSVSVENSAPASKDTENSKPVIRTPRGGDRTNWPINEPNDGEHNYANPWPTVQCAFCGDTMAGQHYRSSHAYGSVICGKAMNADPRSEWAKKVGITPTFDIDDKTTWSDQVKKRSQFYIEANGPIHPETKEPVHTGPDGLTLRNPEFEDGEQEWTREDVIKNWKDFDPNNLDYYMNKHGITEDELTSTDAGKEPVLDANKTHAEPTVTPPVSVAPSVANNVSTQMASVSASTGDKPFWAANNPNWNADDLQKSTMAGLAAGKKKLPSMSPVASQMTVSQLGKMTSLPSSFKMVINKDTPFYRVVVGGESIDPKTTNSTSFKKNQQLWELAKSSGKAFVTDKSNILTDPDTGEVKGHRVYTGTHGSKYGSSKTYDIHLGHTEENCPDNQTS